MRGTLSSLPKLTKQILRTEWLKKHEQKSHFIYLFFLVLKVENIDLTHDTTTIS